MNQEPAIFFFDKAIHATSLEQFEQQVIHAIFALEGFEAYTPPQYDGHHTRWGVTEYWMRYYGFKGHPRDFPQSLARLVYKNEFIRKPNFDFMARFSTLLASEVIECGVNLGVSRSSQFLQRSLNCISGHQHLVVDGRLGQKSFELLKSTLQADPELVITLIRMHDADQGYHYKNLTDDNTPNEQARSRFVKGWFNKRVAYLERLILNGAPMLSPFEGAVYGA